MSALARRPRLLLAAAALATLLALTGCTLSADPDTDPSAADTPTVSADTPGPDEPDTSPTEQRSQSPSGPEPDEIAADILDAAIADLDTEPVATQTLESDGEQITVEVMSVERTPDGTLLEMRMSSTGTDVTINSRFTENLRTGRGLAFPFIYLTDDSTRYLPWEWIDAARASCLCPGITMFLGEDPLTTHTYFPPLAPETTTVDVEVLGAFLLEDIPVTG